MPPRRELSRPEQVRRWLEDLGRRVTEPSRMTMIGSGALLLHCELKGLDVSLPCQSMDVDPVVVGDELAGLCYDAGLGSDFEFEHGWHVNLMPDAVLRELPDGWEARAISLFFGPIQVILPSVPDLLYPKLKRGEPRDVAHAEWAKSLGLAASAGSSDHEPDL